MSAQAAETPAATPSFGLPLGIHCQGTRQTHTAKTGQRVFLMQGLRMRVSNLEGWGVASTRKFLGLYKCTALVLTLSQSFIFAALQETHCYIVKMKPSKSS